jgi:hypothetical protein
VKGRLVFLGCAVLILSTLIPAASSDIEIALPEDSQAIAPIAFGNVSTIDGMAESPTGICVSENGDTFTVSSYPYWQIIRGESPSSLVAWAADGTVLWAIRYSSWTLMLFDVATDGSHIYVTGKAGVSLFLGKYDFEGQGLWNRTWEWPNITDGYTTGSRICLLNDGTVLVVGYTVDSSEHRTYDFLVAFNETGQPQWHYQYELAPSIASGIDSIYVLGNDSLQKRDSSGSVIWSTTETSLNRIACVSDLRIYTFDYWGSFPQTSTTITARSITTGHEVCTTNLRLCDSSGETYNSSGMDFDAIGGDSLLCLMGVQYGDWYLEGMNESLQLRTHTNLLDRLWLSARLKTCEDGSIRVAGLHHILGLTLAVFSSEQLIPVSGNNEGRTSFLLVGFTVIGVVIFDVVFIFYLRRKHPRTR